MISMKKILNIIAAAAVCTFIAMPVSAKSGVDLGYLNSYYKTKLNGSDKSTKGEPMNGFYVGVNNDVRLFAGLSIQPGLYYSYLNSMSSEEGTGFNMTGSYTEHALNIPIHIKYTFSIVPAFGVYVFAGPTLSLGLVASDKLSVSGDLLGQQFNGSVSYNRYSGNVSANGISDDILNNTLNQYLPSERMNRFDVLMGGGIGLDLIKFITVKGGFDYGLMNRFKGDLADTGTLNRMQFYIALGVKF